MSALGDMAREMSRLRAENKDMKDILRGLSDSVFTLDDIGILDAARLSASQAGATLEANALLSLRERLWPLVALAAQVCGDKQECWDGECCSADGEAGGRK